MGGLASRLFRSSKGGDAQKTTTPEHQAGTQTTNANEVRTATLGAGCYWGTEKYFRKHKFEHGTIVDVKVGFAGGHKPNPSYREVCSGTTGHVEVAEIKFTGDAMMFAEMLKFFFMFHDPTTENRQGNDVGDQYASTVFASDSEQRKVAEKVIEDLQTAMDTKGSRFRGKKVVTRVRDPATFYPAHEDHQRYLQKNPGGYCNHKMYISAWPGTTELSDDLKTTSTTSS